jgi:two-component system LytT family response regulator
LNLSCIIIEDEPLATEKLEGFISKMSSLHLKQSFDNAIDGMQFIQNNSVDIVFLDIQMKQLTGIQMLEALSIKPYIIITSAYAEYALKGYELCVFDYLLKPFGFDRFLKAVNKVIDDKKVKSASVETQPTQIFIKSEHRLENVLIADILYIEGMKEYLRIVLPNRKIMTKLSFKKILDQLPQDQFIQVHKSWAVQLNKIEAIERNRIKISDIYIPIGDTFKNMFREAL